jgi:S-adenosylmethionine synthetase
LIPRIIAKYPAHAPLFNDAIKYHINPTGKFVIGGPHTQDLQEEKSLLIRMEEKELTVVVLSLEKIQVKWIVVPRHIAKNLVAAGVADEILVQVSYRFSKTNGYIH